MNAPERSQAIPHELLLGQAGFLRRLARDLVRDPHAADDAVQDAWLAALEHPPRHQGNLRGWLGTILRNIAAQRGEARSRREHHEARAARTDPGHGGGSGETVRLVTDLVLALDEPYRATVLARYFEELTPAQIAERERVPLATVKSRLQRALEMLRVRLQRERGTTWHAGLVALLVPAQIGKGGVLMSLKSKLAIAAALLLAGWFVAHEWKVSSKPAEPSVDPRAAAKLETPHEEPAKIAAAVESDAKDPARALNPADPAASAPAGADEVPDTLFTGSLLDETGKPIRKAWFGGCSITDANGVRLYCDTKSGGAFIFAHVPYGQYWVNAGVVGFRTLHDSVELSPAAAHLHKDFKLARTPSIRIRATTPDGTPLMKALALDQFGSEKVTLVPIATRERPGEMLDEAVGSLNNSFGIGTFWNYGPLVERLPADCMGVVLLDQDPPAYVSLLNWHAVLDTKELHAGDEEVHFILRPEDVLAKTATIRVQVLDSNSLKPLGNAGVWIRAHGEDQSAHPTGPDGIALLEGVRPFVGEVCVGAKDHALFSVQVSARPGVVTDLGQVMLEPGIELHGKVVDPEGQPASPRLMLMRLDRTAGRYVEAGTHIIISHGDLTVQALGRELYLLRAGTVRAFDDEDAGAAKAVCPPVVLDLRSGVAPNSLRVQLVPASRLTLVMRGETSEFMRFRVSDAQGAEMHADRFWNLAPYPMLLPPGTYTVELLSPERAVLATKSVTLGATPLSVELSR